MEDRELLELAAKALGKVFVYGRPAITGGNATPFLDGYGYWNPLKDDGDCAQLEVELCLDIQIDEVGIRAVKYLRDGMEFIESIQLACNHGGDRNMARRRASVEIAAEIGRAKP
ncbi:hypothetical protein D3C81_1725770 [compost metagenome]